MDGQVLARAQEAVIGASFVLAASDAALLLAANPHGGEHLKELLVGQILWVSPGQLVPAALVYAAVAAAWFARGEAIGRSGFYLLFALAVTVSVQLVGLYLVFATSIIPALATPRVGRHRIAAGCVLGTLGHAVGLVFSAVADLPSGPAIVRTLTALAVAFAFARR